MVSGRIKWRWKKKIYSFVIWLHKRVTFWKRDWRDLGHHQGEMPKPHTLSACRAVLAGTSLPDPLLAQPTATLAYSSVLHPPTSLLPSTVTYTLVCHTHTGVSHRLPTATKREIIAGQGCSSGDPQSNSQHFWQTHCCPMLLCLIPVAALGSQSFCCIHLDSSLLLTCACSPFPVWHHEGLGYLSWSRQHRGTGRWAILTHSYVCFSAKVKSRKKLFPTYAELSEKMEGRGREANFRSWWPTGCGLQNQNETRHWQEAFAVGLTS